jgi:hypothetical protein
MGYYMRFIYSDPTELTAEMIQRALKAIDEKYAVSAEGEMAYGGVAFGVLEINLPGTELFDEELDEFREEIEEEDEQQKAVVLKTLDAAQGILAVQVLSGGADAEQSLDWLEPLWDWLFENRNGLLQADLEGFYDKDGPVLEFE